MSDEHLDKVERDMLAKHQRELESAGCSGFMLDAAMESARRLARIGKEQFKARERERELEKRA